MSGSQKKTDAEELIESLLKDMDASSDFQNNTQALDGEENLSDALEGLLSPDKEAKPPAISIENVDYNTATEAEYEATRLIEKTKNVLDFSLESEDATNNLVKAMGALVAEDAEKIKHKSNDAEMSGPPKIPDIPLPQKDIIETAVIDEIVASVNNPYALSDGDSDKTQAVAGFQKRSVSDYDDKVKISIGQNRVSSGYQAWSSGGSADSNLGQAENLRIAQEKIIEIEQENDKLRLQNEELMAASEIIKERSDLLSAQLNEYRRDREGLEESFKNEIVLLRNHLSRKDAELQKAQFKSDELESRLKFDMKKIRIRERELENRLELIRAEKNAVVKNKDEQILDLRRKMDVLQMEVESYRQKCVELNKSVESSQESFKRTTRALRLAMANLELQEENKVPLKKVD